MRANAGQKLLMTGSTFAVTWGIVGHGGEGALIAAGLASFVFSNADKIIGKFTGGHTSPQPVEDDYPTEEEIAAYREMQRLQSDGNDLTHLNDENLAAFDAEWEAARAEVASTFYRGIDEDDLPTVVFRGQKPVNAFSDLLKTGWRPSLDQIYLGTKQSGEHIFVPVAKLWHVALAGATGHGKSSLMRLLMAQLCSLQLSVVLLNPHYTIYDLDQDEDWTPFTPYLKRDPLECAEMANIETMLRWMATDLLPRRIERKRRGQSAGKPFFFILDEFPDIKDEIKDAPALISKLLRQGRKYGIYLIVASQGYDVKTLGVEGEGGIRKCFRTIFYVGGDPVSVKELLNKKVSDIPENDLGQGTIMLKCATIKDPIIASVPYLDNLSLYILLGDTTYVAPSSQEVHTDELEDVTNRTVQEGGDDLAAG